MSNSHDVVRSYSYKGRHRRETLQMRKAAVAVATVGAAAAAPLIGGGVAHADTSVWDRVAQCESTNNWSISTGNGFYGGLQFTSSTWAAYGGTQYAPEANLASKAQQIAVAQRVLASQGPGAWPVCSVQAGLTSGNGGASSSAAASSESQAQTQTQSQPQAATQQAPSHPAESTPAQPDPTPVQSVKSLGGSITGGNYVVELGDTLSKIANRAHVNWHSLYSQNKKIVGSNPNLIFPGQKLSLR
jgi:nucleoid-associated protein YgaU